MQQIVHQIGHAKLQTYDAININVYKSWNTFDRK